MGTVKPQHNNWWTTFPGVITAVATLITAVGGFILVLHSFGKGPNGKNVATDSSSKAASTITLKDSSKIEGVVGTVNGKNVNVGTNYGHVGDEYNGVKQRMVTPELISRILSMDPNKEFPIEIGKTAADPETIHFANDLMQKLQAQGYTNINIPEASFPSKDFTKHTENILAFPDTIYAKKESDDFYIFVPAAKNYY